MIENIIERNRKNSQKSTGPKTEAGKAAMRHNAVKWGFYARHHVLKGEDQVEFDDLHAALTDEWQPFSDHTIELVMNLTAAKWKMIRARRIEDDLFSSVMDLQSPNCLGDAFKQIGPDLDRLRRYETPAIRSAEKVEAELTRLAAERPTTKEVNVASFDDLLRRYLQGPAPGDSGSVFENPAADHSADPTNDLPSPVFRLPSPASGSVPQNGPAEAPPSDLPSSDLPSPESGSVSQFAENEEDDEALDEPAPTPSCNFDELEPSAQLEARLMMQVAMRESGSVSHNDIARQLARWGTLPPEWEEAYLKAA